MSKFAEWCVSSESTVASHRLSVMEAVAGKRAHAVKVVAGIIPGYYAEPERMSELLTKLGRPAIAKYIEEKLPSKANIRSGDLGEVICNAYVHEGTAFKLGIKRLRWKDHRNMSMRGEDVLAFQFIGPSQKLSVLKAEVKSGAKMSSTVIRTAREALDSNSSLPSAHALSFVADRLSSPADKQLRDALDDLLKTSLKPSQVTHLLFTFSGNNPAAALSKNLTSYVGGIKQSYVAVHVDSFPTFVKDVFESVSK